MAKNYHSLGKRDTDLVCNMQSVN